MNKDRSGEMPFFESGQFYSPEYVIRNTYFTDRKGNILLLSPENLRNPEISDSIPYIIVYLGPARSGTTAIAALFAGMENIAGSYFQPFKNGIRHGGEIYFPFNLQQAETPQSETGTTTLPLGTISHLNSLSPNEPFVIFTKDTLGPLAKEELFDPVDILLRIGIPSKKIIFIPTLRNPLEVYASLQNFVPGGMSIGYLSEMQKYLFSLYEGHSSEGLTVIPFAYELIHEVGAENAIKALIKAINSAKGPILNEEFSLKFNPEYLGVDKNWNPLPPEKRINCRMFWGEADPYGKKPPDFTYWEEAVLPTLQRGEYKPTSGTAADSKGAKGVKADNLPESIKSAIIEKCIPTYSNFYAISRGFLEKYLPRQ